MELFLNFLLYAGAGLALLFVGLLLFEATTKTKEFQLIGKGNQAAAMSIGGKLLGLAFVLGSAIANSLSIADMLIWGAVGIAAQIVFFYLAELITIRFSISKAIEEDNKAVGIMVLLLSLSVGWVIGQCLTY
jgi:putative membrane protein